MAKGGIRLQRFPDNIPDGGTETGSDLGEPRTIETHFDGQTFAWGPGQVRNFLDEGVGRGHYANLANASAVRADGLYATNGKPEF